MNTESEKKKGERTARRKEVTEVFQDFFPKFESRGW